MKAPRGFQNTERKLMDCLNSLDPFVNESGVRGDEKRAGNRMIWRFLDWCKEQGILGRYDMDRIAKVFEGHNAAVRARKDGGE